MLNGRGDTGLELSQSIGSVLCLLNMKDRQFCFQLEMQTILLEVPEMFWSWHKRLRKERKFEGAGVDRQDIFLSSDPSRQKKSENTLTTEDQVHGNISSRNLAHGDEIRISPNSIQHTSISILYLYRQNHQTS